LDFTAARLCRIPKPRAILKFLMPPGSRMTVENYLLPDKLLAYARRVSLRETEVQSELRAATAVFPGKNMQIPPEMGQFLAFLVEITGARNILELGTFTGYSALTMAMAMPEDGRIVACDINESAHVLCRQYWSKAGVADRIELRVGECADSLSDLIAEGRAESFDLAFIDADKPGYAEYFEACLTLLRPGGLMAFDNVFMKGDVVDETPRGKYTPFMQRFNEMIHRDQRVSMVTLPFADGLTLARKRDQSAASGQNSRVFRNL
jgi:predicted O-methyltransferase YrrM